MVSTRRKSDLYLIGQPIDHISENKLPSVGDVLRRLFSLTMRQNSLREACNLVSDEICSIWCKANIPTKAKPNIVTKIMKLHGKYRSVQKSKGKKSESQTKSENTFKESLNYLFDIAHNDALQLMKVEEDRLFLTAQRDSCRRGYIGTVDRKALARDVRKRKRDEKLEKQKKREEIRKMEMSIVAEFSSSSDFESAGYINDPHDSDGSIVFKLKPSSSGQCQKKRIVTPDLAMALDRGKISDRSAFMVLASTVNALGGDVDDVVLSRSTLQRERTALRKKIAEDIKQSFATDVPMTVHWDGKILEDITGCKKTERLPILVSAEGNSKLLAVPKLCSGKGIDIANAVIESLQDWNLENSVQATCFDTTASNTGNKQGACNIIESKLGRPLLQLACRHHINEIIISDVFDKGLGAPAGPEIQLFKRFQV